MKILIVSSSPWNLSNSFGNTFSNLFSDIPDITVALVCCASGLNDSEFVSHCFQIKFSDVIRSLRKPATYAGKEVCVEKTTDAREVDNKLLNRAKLMRWQVFFWARDVIWKCGKWKSPNLDSFLDNFKPDLLYIPIYYQNYMLDVAQYVIDYCKVPVVGHISDDNYTMRQFSLSPLFWIDRLIKRRKIRRLVKYCRYLHVISQFQKEEYERDLKVECRIFHKTLDFDRFDVPIHETSSKSPLFIYTGNIGCGRWKILVLIGQAISKLNSIYGKTARLEVYSCSPCSKQMLRRMNIPGAMEFKGGVSGQKALELQATAEVLVHVESFNLKERLKVHQSFSTKIIDYLHTGNCVFAVGPEDVASIDYLKSGDAAIIALSKREIEAKIDLILRCPEEVQRYAHRGWEYAKKNNDVSICRPQFYTDLKYALSKSNLPN